MTDEDLKQIEDELGRISPIVMGESVEPEQIEFCISAHTRIRALLDHIRKMERDIGDRNIDRIQEFQKNEGEWLKKFEAENVEARKVIECASKDCPVEYSDMELYDKARDFLEKWK